MSYKLSERLVFCIRKRQENIHLLSSAYYVVGSHTLIERPVEMQAERPRPPSPQVLPPAPPIEHQVSPVCPGFALWSSPS